jgi:hypothetical protein
MVNDLPDPVRFLELLGDLIVAATEAAIQVEKLGNKLTKIHDMDILCVYSVGSVEGEMDNHVFQRTCAEHSAVHSR